MTEFKQLRIKIKALNEKIKPFDNLVEARAVRHDESHINNNALLIWSSHEEFLDCNELESYRTLSHDRFLLAQELEMIYRGNLLKNRKEIIKIKRDIRKSGVVIPEDLMICELRELLSKQGLH